MQLHEVQGLIEAQTPEDAEELIRAGWVLVAIVPGTRYTNGPPATAPIYVLGHSGTKQ